jgi:hypothetical protein
MHTKGKWFNNGGRIYAQQGDEIREICDVGLVNNQSKEDTANARLITAAPELLEACKRLLYFVEHYGNDRHIESSICSHCSIINKAKAAIATSEWE